MYVVLVYDVSQQENGAKRWSKIFKICKREDPFSSATERS